MRIAQEESKRRTIGEKSGDAKKTDHASMPERVEDRRSTLVVPRATGVSAAQRPRPRERTAAPSPHESLLAVQRAPDGQVDALRSQYAIQVLPPGVTATCAHRKPVAQVGYPRKASQGAPAPASTWTRLHSKREALESMYQHVSPARHFVGLSRQGVPLPCEGGGGGS